MVKKTVMIGIKENIIKNVINKGFHTIKGGTPESATEIGGARGITRDVGFLPTVTRSKY